jgi:hypothetical protein
MYEGGGKKAKADKHELHPKIQWPQAWTLEQEILESVCMKEKM